MKTTSLHQHHIDLHAKMVDFGGFDMPLYYSNITSEHLAVRQHVGVFDVSHMGEILITGIDALPFVNKLVSNTITDNLQKVTYALLCNHDGNIIDDLLVYVFHPQKILLVVNASNIEKDFSWIVSQKDHEQVELKNLSDDYSQIAIQGPLAQEICSNLFDMTSIDLKFMEYVVTTYLDGDIILSRTGYTGEDGYEIYGKHNLIKSLWETSMTLGVTPCGLGCRDTLRFEASLPLYGHELSESINPIEAGLNFAVKSESFIGSEKIHQSKNALSKKLVGIEMLEKGIPRADYLLFKDEKEIGYITTGYLLPTQTTGLALAYVEIDEAFLGNEIDVDIRNKRLKCKIVKKIFMKKNYKKGE